jgi:NAD(P)-dependent dehydrogenase (short-subunit alcohol dehydrogenase family)
MPNGQQSHRRVIVKDNAISREVGMTDGKGRTALVTGATDGVGRVVARELAGQGWRVLVHGRDRKRGEALVREIEQAGGRATFLAADLASLAEVRRLADEVRGATDRLELLVNNAGIGTAGNAAHRQASADGHELRFAVNYLAGFLLTRLLLPLLKASAQEKGGARIVNVASAGQQAIDFSDVMLTRHYSGVAAYCQSKLAQILSTVDLADELKGSGVTVNALHPSTYMNTTMVAQAGVSPMSRVEDGAAAILQLAVSPALEGRSGLYFNVMNEARANPQAYDPAARRKLRALSLELAGLEGSQTPSG